MIYSLNVGLFIRVSDCVCTVDMSLALLLNLFSFVSKNYDKRTVKYNPSTSSSALKGILFR